MVWNASWESTALKYSPWLLIYKIEYYICTQFPEHLFSLVAMPTKRILYITVFLLPLIIIVCNNKSVSNSEEDKQYIEVFAKNWKLSASVDSVHTNFESEIQLVRNLQDSVIAGIKHFEIPHQSFGNVSCYYNNHKGLCYDRAVLMEKMLDFYGFSFRHVYLSLVPNGSSASFLGLMQKATPSHALLEVKTAKGWMAIGTNANWVGLSDDGKVLTTEDVREKLKRRSLKLKYTFDDTHVFWKEKGSDFIIIYGLYSRHGDFFNNTNNRTASILPALNFLPDYNLRMLLYNL